MMADLLPILSKRDPTPKQAKWIDNIFERLGGMRP